MFGSIFDAFRIVDYVPTARAFFLIRHHCSKKVPVETESSLSSKNKEKYILEKRKFLLVTTLSQDRLIMCCWHCMGK